MIRVGIVGLGYWGPNLLRNFVWLPESQVTAVCDLSGDRLKHVSAQYPHVYPTTCLEEILNRNMIDAAVIATPTKTHYSIAKRALEQGLHTFVEKPLATSSIECEDLINLAASRQVVLFVGHVFVYSAPVLKLKELITKGELGRICYVSCTRLNLGPIRQDVNALWDLAPHDISIILDLLEPIPVSVNCQGLAYLNESIHDVCFLTLHFSNGTVAMVHVSWLDPNKRRLMTVVGDKKMVLYDDIEPLEKIKIYDKGVEGPGYSDTFGEFHFSYRYGDTYSPRLNQVEPLKAECQHFIECVREGKKPRTDGYKGLRVVKVLEAAEYSLRNGGGRVEVEQVSELLAKSR